MHPIWVAILAAVGSGLISALLSTLLAPYIAARLNLKNWRSQKDFEFLNCSTKYFEVQSLH